jgi:CBS domain-containing protein
MMLVADAMNRSVVTVSPDMWVADAAALVRRTGAEHLLVVDDEETLVGILCACDLSGDEGERVFDRMTVPVLTVRPDADVAEAARTMGDCELGCLPVALGGLVLGTLGAAELQRAGIVARPHCHHQHHHRHQRSRGPVGKN